MFIFDAHLDLAMNAMEWNRDLTWSIEAIRKSEAGLSDLPGRGNNTVTFEEMRKGTVGLCMATQLARYVKPSNDLPGWNSPHQAWAHTQGQLAWYKAMEAIGELRQITNLQELKSHITEWNNATEKIPIGYILTLEGADSIITLKHLEKSYEQGLRAIGAAHFGPGTYAHGTNSSGGIGRKGKALLKRVEQLNLILDATHLCDQSFWETMDHYNGAIWASHTNCRAIVNHHRQFSDEQIKELLQRKAVIGTVLNNGMLLPDWQESNSTTEKITVTLEHLVNHIDHICQLAGNALHVGIGTDLDGGFGREKTPSDMDTIADLQKLPPLLRAKGYSSTDIENIMHRNFLSFLERCWQ